MRKALIAAALLVTSTGFLLPSTAQAAPAPISDANLKTTNPATTCVRGAARPLVNQTSPVLQAFVPSSDPYPRPVTVEFRLNDLSDGTTVFTSESSTKGPEVWFEAQSRPTLLDGKTYAWQARVFDGTEYSAWSKTCEFSIDAVKPNAPGLTITPAGPYKVGQKVTLHFTNGGSTDVARYSYHLLGKPPVDVNPCPGTATLKLTTAGPDSIAAVSFDKAGNLSSGETVVNIKVS
jgi:hypothetical protein